MADVANNDVFNDFEKWEDSVFWPALSKIFGGGEDEGGDNEGLEVEIATTLRSSHPRQEVKQAIILKSEVLNTDDTAPKRHIEIKLPTDMQYKSGDYLAVLPMSPVTTIRRVVKHFGLPWDSIITVKSGETTLPCGTPLAIYDLLASYVELGQPATRRVCLAPANQLILGLH